MEKLKECPFCGGKSIEVKKITVDRREIFYAQCESCWATASNTDSEIEAVSTWNKRNEMYSCPFCGGVASIEEFGSEDRRYFAVSCDNCGASSGVHTKEAQAIEAWKHRV